MKRKMISTIAVSILISAFVFSFCNCSYAKTFWCNPANSGKEDGSNKLSGYKTLWKTIRQIQPGDTIIIANGDWRDGGDEMSIRALGGGTHFPPSGTSLSNMTTIRAETDWQVFLPKLEDLGVGREYMWFQGIVFTDFSGLSRWNKSKIIKCGFLGPKKVGNVCALSLSYCEGSLVEECIAWGGGRYKFLNYMGNHNIFRRCVARHDWYVTDGKTASQESNFRGYGSKNSFWQNCISIDSDRLEYQTPKGISYEDGDFWIGDQSGAGGNVVDGCMVIKGMYNAFALGGPQEQGEAKTVLLKNSAALGPSLEGIKGLTGAITYGTLRATVENCLFVDFDKGNQHFISHNKEKGSLLLADSIARDVGKMKDVNASYSCFFNAGRGDYGKHAILRDPLKSGLFYPCRIEPESLLSTSGSEGGICGPTILKKIGVSGTLYGEPGWDVVTKENLWPFPNQERIQELMRKTVDGVSGIYGFCQEGQTLTNYIWGYFGNTVPPFNVTAIPGDGKVTLKWNPPAKIVMDSITGFNVYKLDGQNKRLIGGTVAGNTNCSKTILGLNNTSTYEFAVTAIDKVKGESGLSYNVQVTPAEQKESPSVKSPPAVPMHQNLKAGLSEAPKEKLFTNKFGMEFVLIQPGTFTMGLPSSDQKIAPHQVTLTEGFHIQKAEITQGQWKRVMGGNPSFFKECGNNCPVEQVSWIEVQQFINKLNSTEKTVKYRLPTEAEWEYACRAGNPSPFAFGDCLTTEEANYNGNFPFMKCEKGIFRERTVSSEALSPNAWGLKGMHGNVWEWCQDWLGKYTSGPVTNPKGPPSGEFRVIRGGGWNSYAASCRSGNRSGIRPTEYFANLGFRLVAEP